MKHISLKVSDVIKNILPDTLEKDLQDNEIICPTCHGLGVVKRKNPFGLKEKEVEYFHMSKINWYDNEALTFCPDCYNGVKRLCEFCGKPIPKGYIDKCDCEQYKKLELDKSSERWNKIITKAKCVKAEDVTTMLYCEENSKYYMPDDIDSFIDDWYEEDSKNRPKELWVTYKEEISLDADSICESACDDLHEDAGENLDTEELQGLLDDWCKEQTGTETYYPCHEEYVKVEDAWFD